MHRLICLYATSAFMECKKNIYLNIRFVGPLSPWSLDDQLLRATDEFFFCADVGTFVRQLLKRFWSLWVGMPTSSKYSGEMSFVFFVPARLLCPLLITNVAIDVFVKTQDGPCGYHLHFYLQFDHFLVIFINIGFEFYYVIHNGWYFFHING